MILSITFRGGEYPGFLKDQLKIPGQELLAGADLENLLF